MLLIATRSDGKLRELRHMFAAAGVAVMDLRDGGIPETAAEADLETAATFEENALLKAHYFWSRSGMPTIADDSGLEVMALGGAPGVLSKRWSGRLDLVGQALDDENNRLLLSRLGDGDDRRARYVCAAAFVDGAREVVVRGETSGVITRVARGTNGFGYDPYFESEDLGKTFGEASAAEKERVSHRGRAIAKLLACLKLR